MSRPYNRLYRWLKQREKYHRNEAYRGYYAGLTPLPLDVHVARREAFALLATFVAATIGTAPLW